MFLEVKAASSTSVERSLSSSGTKLRHIIFVIIESGMMLLAIQLVRTLLFTSVENAPNASAAHAVFNGLEYFDGINKMFNVIISSVH